MQYGENEILYEKIEKRENREVSALRDKPELYDDLIPVWNAFNDLSLSRTVGFNVDSIQPQAIVAWMELNEIEDRKEMYQLIMELDRKFLQLNKGN